MGRQHSPDFDQSIFGDLVMDNNDVIKVTEDRDVAIRNICINRIKAMEDDWEAFMVTANLESFVGQKNTREIAEKMKEQIILAMTFDSFLLPNELSVDIVPIDETSVGILSEIDNVGTISLIFDYYDGVTEVR